MKKTILVPNEDDDSIERIEYKYYDTSAQFDDERSSLKLDPSETAAYWWIRRIKKVTRFMASKINDPEYSEYRDYLQAVGKFAEVSYRELYLRLVEMYRKRILSLDDDYTGCITQGTNKECHELINEVINKLLKDMYPDGKIIMPDVSLSTYYQDASKLNAYKEKVRVKSLPSDRSEEVHNCYSKNWEYIYVLSGDRTRLYFSNLIKKVIITLAEWKKLDSFSLNRICLGFCVGYIEEYDSAASIEELAEEFMNAVNSLMSDGFDAHLVDNPINRNNGSSSESKILDYRPNPVDNNGLDSYKEIAERIIATICTRRIDLKRMIKKLDNR